MSHGRSRSALIAVWLLLAAGPLTADTRSWHAFDAVVLGGSRLELTLHTRFRYDGVLDSFQQGRAGALVRFHTLPRWALIGGYYYGKEEDHPDQWRNFHRPFLGWEVSLVRREGGIALAGRGLVERLVGGRAGDFTRYRQRLRLTTDRRLGPYLATEWFFDAKGYLTSRHSAGVRWRFARRASLEAGYLLDLRRADLGAVLHLFTTQMQFDLRPGGR